MIVGGYAVAWFGHPRFTKDLDIFYRLDPDNIARLKQALIQFGFGEEELTPDLFSQTRSFNDESSLMTRIPPPWLPGKPSKEDTLAVETLTTRNKATHGVDERIRLARGFYQIRV